MIMISDPAPRAEPYSSAVTRTSTDSPESQLAAIERAASNAIRSEPDRRGTLQRAVADYTLQMKGMGEYPEKVLVAVKSAVRNVAAPLIRKSCLDDLVRDDLVRDAAQWSIAAYFDTHIEDGQPRLNHA